MTKNEISLNPKQSDLFESDHKEIIYLSGVGGGKTFMAGLKSYVYSQKYQGSLGLISAPTFDVMKNATFKGVSLAWSKLGLIEGEHYVIGVRPPPDWGVEPFSKLNSNRVVTWRNGSYIVLESLDNFNKVRGAEYDYIFVDEFRDVKFSNVREVLKGRLRGEQFKKAKKQQQLIWISTPPDNIKELKDVIDAGQIQLIAGTTFDNQANLPENYIADLIETYDNLTVQREIYAKLLDNVIHNKFAHAYNRDYHFIDYKANGIELNLSEPILISFDFNVNPMTAIAGQSSGEYMRIFKEFTEENSNTKRMCLKIKSWLGDKKVSIQVTGDANGFSRSSKSSRNDYQIIQNELEVSKYQIIAPRKNPSHRDSRVLVNSVLDNFDCTINATCEELDNDLSFSTVDANGSIDKKKHDPHKLDAFRYYIQTFHGNFLKRK